MKDNSEYLMIREEIMWRLKSMDSLSTFAYTVFVTIIGITLSNDIIELFLLPYLIIVPIALKVANHRYTICNLAGYLLKLESEKKCPFNWGNFCLENNSYKITKDKIIYFCANLDFFFMCLISCLLFWIQYFRLNLFFSIFQICIYIFIQFLVIIFVFYVSISYLNIPKIKKLLNL